MINQKMTVKNMTSSKTNRAVPNQFIITVDGEDEKGERLNVVFFQSYNSIIVKRTFHQGKVTVEIDSKYWDYSRTTSKYRAQFLNENTKETRAKIKSGVYKLVNLN